MMETDDRASLPSPRSLHLTKSRFLAGLQCPKRLYLQVHQQRLASPPDTSIRAMLEMGTEIGILARRRFPGGTLVCPGCKNRDATLAETVALMNDENVPAIFEGAFQHDGVLIRADILQRVFSPDGIQKWRLIEVKSSTKIKDIHLDDLAVQSHVILGAGFRLEEICLLHVNTDYVYAGHEVDLAALFTMENVSEAVMSRRSLVVDRITAMKSLLSDSHPPTVEPDHHCHTPYECPFWSHCTKDKPARWIYHLPGSRQSIGRLIESGIFTIDEIPAETVLTSSQRKVKENVEWISDRLWSVLQAVRYPVHHLDFETVMLAVPRFPATRPYQAIPFQWSNDIEEETGGLSHHDFLHCEAGDPRRAWAESLIESLGQEGSICVYSSYERAMMEQVSAAFPEYRSAFLQIMKRLWDLLPVIRDHYYHPGFQGSYSIKSVLPAMIPSLGYSDLAIQNGAEAAGAYYRMIYVETDWVEQATIREALLRYCGRDTLAMVELRKALKEKGRWACEAPP